MEELKKCPFCGGEAQIRITSDFAAYVGCTRCGAKSKGTVLGETKRIFYPPNYKDIEEVATEATRNWNARV